jgi:PIN domain nuclease of toxin-antitoxin system
VKASFLLDTHAAVWLLKGSPRLGRGARHAIEAADEVAIASISLLELAMLARRGKVRLVPDLPTALQQVASRLDVLPLDAADRPGLESPASWKWS